MVLFLVFTLLLSAPGIPTSKHLWFTSQRSSLPCIIWVGIVRVGELPCLPRRKEMGNWLLLPYTDHQPILFKSYSSTPLSEYWYLKFLSLFGTPWPQICSILTSLSGLWFQYFNHALILLTFRNINVLKPIIFFSIFFVFVNFHFLPLYYYFIRVLSGVEIYIKSAMFNQKSTCIFLPTGEQLSVSFKIRTISGCLGDSVG